MCEICNQMLKYAEIRTKCNFYSILYSLCCWARISMLDFRQINKNDWLQYNRYNKNRCNSRIKKTSMTNISRIAIKKKSQALVIILLERQSRSNKIEFICETWSNWKRRINHPTEAFCVQYCDVVFIPDKSIGRHV